MLLGIGLLAAYPMDVAAEPSKDLTDCVMLSDTKPDLALHACTRIIQSGQLSDKALGTALTFRGIAYAEKDDLDRALADFSQAIDADPGNALPFARRAGVYTKKQDYTKALQDANKAIVLNPKESDGYFYRGSVAFSKKEYDLAIADFNRAAELNPKSDAAYHNLGVSYHNKRDYEAAIRHFNRALELKPSRVESLSQRGITYFMKEDYVRAGQDLDAALLLNPNDYDALVTRAAIHASNKKVPEALRDVDQAIRLRPNESLTYHIRGLLHHEWKHYDQALSDFNRGIALDPNGAHFWRARGNVYCDQGQHHRAIEDLNHAIGLDGQDAENFRDRGYVYQEMGRFDLAMTDFSEAIKLRPDDAEGYLARGRVRFFVQSFREAIADFAKAAQLNPKDMYVPLWLFLARSRSGENGRPDLETAAARLDLSEWPGPMIAVYLGRVTSDDVLRAGLGSGDEETLRGRACEAYYFQGQQGLVQGAPDRAAAAFEKAVATGMTNYNQYVGATVELARLGRQVKVQEARSHQAQDAHGLHPSDYLIASEPFDGKGLFVHVAEATSEPEMSGGADFLRLTDGRLVSTRHFWRTYPIESVGDLQLGEPAFCFTSNQAGNLFNAPANAAHARSGGWLMGSVTDLSRASDGVARIDTLTCSLSAVRVTAARRPPVMHPPSTRGHQAGQHDGHDSEHEHGVTHSMFRSLGGLGSGR